jgi:Rad3-related DNA helicase
MNFDFSNQFPYDSVRDAQEQSINYALDQFINKGKKFVVLELGTGCGKSGVGLTLARYLRENDNKEEDFLPGAYFITTQKVLQDQYVKDFGPSTGGVMRSIKSSTNYDCSFYPKQSCGESRQALKNEPKHTKFFKACAFNCKYKRSKSEFIASPESVTNFPYFLTEAALSGQLEPRQTLVIDEAHNIETELSRFVEVTISEYFGNKILKLDMPSVLNTQKQAIDWLTRVYLPKLNSHLNHINIMMAKYSGLESKIKEMTSISRQIDLLKGHKQKIVTFLKVHSKDNWVMNVQSGMGRKKRKIEFKPIDISPFTEQYLFRLGQRIIMMSATILNKEAFCESLGIDQKDVGFISVPTPFPLENRPIFYAPVGKMSRNSIDDTLPKLAEAVKAILDNHPDEKGIIHAHTFKIAQYLKRTLRSRRIIIHDSSNREEILQKHINSKKPTVLISPSMTEGVDLKGETSRFQIICKIPYPYLGDKLCRKRMNKWSWWYPMQTTKTIVQATGRSVRSMDDFAVTYILDADWGRFYSQNKMMFPQSFRESIKAV